ncbi:MAG: hypothetical protein U0232_11630 [Thermomicrobiales bacterium]
MGAELTLVSTFARPDGRLKTILEAWRVIYLKLGPERFCAVSWPWLFSWRYFERPNAASQLQRYVAGAVRQQERCVRARWMCEFGQEWRERLGAIQVPTLVISGSEDALVPPYLGRELADHIPGAGRTR